MTTNDFIAGGSEPRFFYEYAREEIVAAAVR
jgi:hypothetical protein